MASFKLCLYNCYDHSWLYLKYNWARMFLLDPFSLFYLRMKENNNGDCIPPVMSTSVKFLRETGEQVMKSITVHKESMRNGL